LIIIRLSPSVSRGLFTYGPVLLPFLFSFCPRWFFFLVHRPSPSFFFRLLSNPVFPRCLFHLPFPCRATFPHASSPPSLSHLFPFGQSFLYPAYGSFAGDFPLPPKVCEHKVISVSSLSSLKLGGSARVASLAPAALVAYSYNRLFASLGCFPTPAERSTIFDASLSLSPAFKRSPSLLGGST